jgi:hypothetical protein
MPPRYIVRVTRWDGIPPRKAAVELQVYPYQSKPVKPAPKPETFHIARADARELAEALIAVADEAERYQRAADEGKAWDALPPDEARLYADYLRRDKERRRPG